MRYVGAFWALDKDLAFRRHFPSINWLRSFSKYVSGLEEWWMRNSGEDMLSLRTEAMDILQRASGLEEVARVVGEAALSEENRLLLLEAELIREGYLVQNAYHEVDTFCSPKKQVKLLKALIQFYREARPLLDYGVPISKMQKLSSLGRLRRLKFVSEREFDKELEETLKELKDELNRLVAEVS
jgi:V/A-type H+-transporting ATPase subunit A